METHGAKVADFGDQKMAGKDKTHEDRYRAPALDKGLDILEFLSSQPNGLTRAEIVKAMGRSPSEIYRMLERLVARDYVSRSLEGDRYALTMKLFILGSHHPPVRRLVARALPLMDVFAQDTQQSVHLVTPDKGAAVVVAQTSGPSNWEFSLRVGARLNLLSTSSGQTLLAFQTPERRREMLAIRGGLNEADLLSKIKTLLQDIRARGYRIGDSLQLVGVQDISVPVLDPAHDAFAVLTCPYLQRVDVAETPDVEAALKRLREVASKLSLMGSRQPAA
ncbi:MAG: IclR family transcriptional regulator [Rhodomicrobiaceae bacterium]